MQTFLPLPDFALSAKVLDRQRLGKQRVEAWQIMKAYMDGGGWRNHPATKMWIDEGCQVALCEYALAMIGEWTCRGYKDSLAPKFVMVKAGLIANGASTDMPSWFGRDDFHASHRSNLLRKDPKWYGQWGWSESPDLPYIWPVRKTQ